MPMISETISWVEDLHAGQTDKAGQPYIGHVTRVYDLLRDKFPDASEDVQHAALLHDTVEDCGVTADDLRKKGYSDETIRIVEAVTKDPYDGLSYAERMDRLARSGIAGALQVKICDLSDNSDPTRLSALPGQQAVSLAKRYSQALEKLNSALTEMAGR